MICPTDLTLAGSEITAKRNAKGAVVARRKLMVAQEFNAITGDVGARGLSGRCVATAPYLSLSGDACKIFILFIRTTLKDIAIHNIAGCKRHQKRQLLL